MSDGDCPTCSALQKQVAELHAQKMMLAGGIRSTLAFIDQQLEEPTMPAKRPRNGNYRGPDLISSVQARLDAVLDQAH